MRYWRLLIVACAAAQLTGCSSDDGPTCSLKGGTQLAAAPWPKFAADTANSGRSQVALGGTAIEAFVLFPPEDQPPIGPVQTAPVLGLETIYVGSSDTNVYAIDYGGVPVDLEDEIQVDGAVTGTPLLGADGTLFVPSNGTLTQFRSDGEIKNIATLPGFEAASPNIWNGDGTAYAGTLSGAFSGVCPNGVLRYQLSFPLTQSTAAVVQDPNEPTQSTPIIVAAGLAGQVRAYNIRGRQRWSFFASSTVDAAVVIDESTEVFYVAASNGRVFAGALANGVPISAFAFAADAGILASPALGRDSVPVPTIYIADQGGTLYALDRATGAVRWRFQADGPIQSTPAVATGGAADVIVFGADVLGEISTSPVPVPIDGRVYAVRDDGDTATQLWQYETGSSIGTASPAIGSDGTIYIGRQGQRLGMGAECPGGDASTTCTVNDGGALYAIAPAALF
jgi:outer membrane protein assembly factor BamB